MIDLQKIEQVAQNIELKLLRRANAFSLGGLKSSFKGNGLQFKEHRNYEWGDDLRHLDWKIWAKTHEAMVKIYEEERNREIVIYLDLSSSMIIGYKGVSKLQASLEIICLLYLLAYKTKDQIHLFLFHESVIDLGKTNGKKGMTLLIKKLLELKIIDENRPLFYRICKNEAMWGEEIRKKISQLYHRRCYYLFFSDHYSYMTPKNFTFFLSRPNTFFFRLLSPLDNLTQLPFLLYGYGQGKKQSECFRSAQSTSLPLSDKKVRPLAIDQYYLQNFIRELWHGVY